MGRTQSDVTNAILLKLHNEIKGLRRSIESLAYLRALSLKYGETYIPMYNEVRMDSMIDEYGDRWVEEEEDESTQND